MQFINFIKSVYRGSLLGDIERDLASAVRATKETGNKSKVTITLEVSKNGQIIDVKGESNPKIARPTRGKAPYFADEDGNLLRDDPDQPRFGGVNWHEGQGDGEEGQAEGDAEELEENTA